MKICAPWEKNFKKIAIPFEEFLHSQTTSGFVLIFMTLLALILANTSFYYIYSDFLHTYIEFNVGSWELKQTLHHWINDGLMTIFFFLI
jgi:NhaA family Na+:H+ antiporter